MIDTSIKADEIPMEKGDRVNFCAQKRIDGPAKLHRIDYGVQDKATTEEFCVVKLFRDDGRQIIQHTFVKRGPNNPGHFPFGGPSGPLLIPAGTSVFMEVTNGGEAIMHYTRP